MTKEKTLKEDWEEVIPDLNIWIPEEEGDGIQGEVVEVIEGKYGINLRVKDKDEKEFITPSHKVLQSRLLCVELGDIIRIEFIRSEPTNKGNPIMLYKVWKKV